MADKPTDVEQSEHRVKHRSFRLTGTASPAGPILVWLGSIIFCLELLFQTNPSMLYFILVPAGVLLSLVASIRAASTFALKISLTAAFPPLAILAWMAWQANVGI